MTKISVFKGFKGSPHTSIGIITIDDFLNGIKQGKWKDEVEQVRTEENKEKRSSIKRGLTSVTIGGIFKERLQDSLIEHSGFICVDIDKYNDKSALLSDPYTYALFHSTSGSGLAVIVKINKEKHKESYTWLSNYYFKKYGISVDEAPKNVASLRFVSYDPDLFLNTRSLQSKTKVDKISRPRSLPIVYGTETVDSLVQQVIDKHINLAESYDEYLALGFSLANGFSEKGRSYFHAICSISDKYDSQQADKQFDVCLKKAANNGITVGTFYYMLKQNGIELPKENQKAVRIAALAKKNGRTKEGVVMHLQQLEGLEKHQAEMVANDVFDRSDIDLSKVASDPDNLIQSMIEWIGMNHPARLNEITRKIEENGTEIGRERFNTIYLRMRMAFNSKEITKDLLESILYSDTIPTFNPITEYFNKNSWRNSSGNIDRLVATIRTDTPNAHVFIRKWLISMIAAYEYKPVRSVLALVGGQNTGKTYWFRHLLPASLQKYYSESKLDAGKDDEMLMTQKWIVMDDEMGGKSKQDEKRFKELTSKQVFSLRAPYARHNEDYNRLAILCGTSNDTDIVNDPTGNTRIFPINVLSINHEAYNEVDKDELLMEIYRAYNSGAEWELTRDEFADLSSLTTDFETIPFERELILEYFAPKTAAGYVEYLTSTKIKDYIESNSKQRILNLKRFSIELKNVFGIPIQKKINGRPQRVYACIKVSGNTQNTENDNIPF
jgi:hypothetical protein